MGSPAKTKDMYGQYTALPASQQNEIHDSEERILSCAECQHRRDVFLVRICIPVSICLILFASLLVFGLYSSRSRSGDCFPFWSESDFSELHHFSSCLYYLINIFHLYVIFIFGPVLILIWKSGCKNGAA